MLHLEKKRGELNDARAMTLSLANEFTALIGMVHEQEEERKPTPSFKLGDYISDRSRSSKKLISSSRLYQEDDATMLYRKKRDELLNLVDKMCKTLAQIKQGIIDSSDFKILVSQQAILRDVSDLVTNSKAIFKGASQVLKEYELQRPVELTEPMKEEIRRQAQALTRIDTPVITIHRAVSPPRDTNELRMQIEKDLAEGKTLSRTASIKQRLANKQSMYGQSSIDAVEELYESKILSIGAMKNSEAQKKSRLDRLDLKQSFMPMSSKGLKDSMIPPEINILKSSMGPIVMDTQPKDTLQPPDSKLTAGLKRSFAIAPIDIKSSNLNLFKKN